MVGQETVFVRGECPAATLGPCPDTHASPSREASGAAGGDGAWPAPCPP